MKEKNDLIVIGPSNGWLYGIDIFSLEKHVKFLKRAEANAVEFYLSNDSQRIKSLLSSQEFGELRHISLHLLDYDESKSFNEQILLVKSIVEKRKPMVVLIHPLNVPSEYWEVLTDCGIPIVIENMDKNKDSGYRLKELERLLQRFQVGFVLDVQHAYEHDSTMGYALDLFQMAGNKLVYFHVSGEAEGNNHALVNKSENCKVITDFLGKVFPEMHVPIILEGEYRTSNELKQEIEFLRAELS